MVLLLKHVEQIIQIITVQLIDCVNLVLNAVLMLMSAIIQIPIQRMNVMKQQFLDSNVQLGHAILFGSKQYALEHQFIVYCGFVYEFGKSYGVQS